MSLELVQSLARPTQSMLAIPPGLHPDVPAEVYYQRELGIANHSGLEEMMRAPAAFKAWLDGQDVETPALRFGRALHCAVFEPERFLRLYAIAPAFGDLRTKAAKEERDKWRAEHQGAEMLSVDDAQTILGIKSALESHELVSTLLDAGAAELTLRWDDPETGLPCKCRIDYYVESLETAVDLKSTLNALPSVFARDVANYGYHRQEAFYRAGFEALGIPLRNFVFLPAEKTPPYLVGLYELDESFLALGRMTNARLMRQLADCLARKEWPGLPQRISTLEAPRWVTQ